MRKKSILAIIALIGLSSFVVLGSSPSLFSKILESVQNNPITRVFSSSAQSEPQKNADEISKAAENTAGSLQNISMKTTGFPAPQVPEEILWRVIFSFPEKLEKMADKARQEGQDDSLWTNYFIRQAGVSIENNQILAEKSSSFSKEVVAIDKRNKQIIEEFRTKNLKLDGQNEKSVSNFTPSTELIALQKQKDEVTLSYRDDFKAAIGEEAFAKFDKWLKEDFSKGFEIRAEPSGTDKNILPQIENKSFAPFSETQKREINLVEGENK
jgi:hypothetical protein